jgi:hypothetical protein
VADIISSLESSVHKFYASISKPDEVRASLINTLYNNQKKVDSPASKKPDNLYDLKILSNLCKDSSIIITKADKSNSLVVTDKTDYETKIYSHLNDETTYRTITRDYTDQFVKKIINDLKTLKQNGKIIPRLYNKFFSRGSF